MTSITISQLFIYPVKSMAQVSQQSSIVDRFGLLNDRRWMLVDENGVYLTQRTHPRLCLIETSLSKGQLNLRLKGEFNITVPLPNDADMRSVRVWEDQCQSYDCGDEVAQCLSKFIAQTCRLVFFPESENRLLDQQYARSNEYTAFSDGFPILLLSQASLDDLNCRMSEPVTMARFRPNIVVSGCEAFAEDDWKEIIVGGLTLRIVKPCSRCIIPTINEKTADKNKEILSVLSTYRKQENKIYFGQNVISNTTGRLDVGMKVKVLKC